MMPESVAETFVRTVSNQYIIVMDVEMKCAQGMSKEMHRLRVCRMVMHLQLEEYRVSLGLYSILFISHVCGYASYNNMLSTSPQSTDMAVIFQMARVPSSNMIIHP